MTTNVLISMPHGRDDVALRVRTVATDAKGIPLDHPPLSTQLVTRDAESISAHLYPGVGIYIDEVQLPPKPARAEEPQQAPAAARAEAE